VCGIVGVIGSKNAVSILLQGLQKLEYRGYDSAGVFVVDEQGVSETVKSVGRISTLAKKIGNKLQGSAGIGHTRWATHGKPSEENAHPQISQGSRFVLVHNGVIENFQKLKEEHLAGSSFAGETDTEVIVQLIERFVAQTDSLEEAFVRALDLIEGSFAFALMDANNPDTIFVAKNKSPLLIGLADGYNLICSDAMAGISETNQFLEIVDGEMVIVKKDSVEIKNRAGAIVERTPYTAQLDLSDTGKGFYVHYMLKEIEEQPAVIRRIVQEYLPSKKHGGINIDPELVKTVAVADRIYIVAAGTSYHAGFAAKDFLEKMTHIPVELCLASEFGYNLPLLSKKPLFIYLSQSGETADSMQVLVKIKELGFRSLTITNSPGSTLSREADYTLLLHAGPEIAVASTKAYSAQIAVAAILAKAVGEYRGNLAALNFDLAKELSTVANAMTAVIDEQNSIKSKVREHFQNTRNAFYIGRGADYFVALEAALKLKEISYIQCEGFAAGELKHGTIALIEDATPVQAIISHRSTAQRTRGNVMEVLSRGARVLIISAQDIARVEDDIIVPTVHPHLTGLAMVVPTQLIAYFAALERNLDVDKPRNLAKSVTVE